VRAHFERGSRPASQAGTQASRAPQGIAPKIDLSHISKPGDVLKAILAKKQEEEAEARQSRMPQRPQRCAGAQGPAPPVVAAAPPIAAPAQPGTAQDRSPAPLRAAHRRPAVPAARHCHASAVWRGGRQGAGWRRRAQRPAVAVAPPVVAVVVKPPSCPSRPRSPAARRRATRRRQAARRSLQCSSGSPVHPPPSPEPLRFRLRRLLVAPEAAAPAATAAPACSRKLPMLLPPPAPLISPLTAPRGTRTLLRPLRRCPRGAWSCRKPGLVRFTRRPRSW
jgi:translation initiation factor IF-2